MFKILMILSLAASAAYSQIHLTPENTVNMRGEVNEESVNVWQNDLARKHAARKLSLVQPLYLVIDSPGGSIDAGLSFIEYAKTIPNLHTITIFGASMASAIQQALPGKRYILSTSVTMFHRAAGGFQGQFADGEVESRLQMAKDIVHILESTNANRMKMTLADYKAAVVNELWIVGSNNLKNAADELTTIICSDSLINSSSNQSFQVFVFSITIRFSNCPLFRSGEVVKGQDAYLKYKSEFNKKLTGIYQRR